MLIWVGCQSGKCWCVGNPTVWTAPARRKGQVFQGASEVRRKKLQVSCNKDDLCQHMTLCFSNAEWTFRERQLISQEGAVGGNPNFVDDVGMPPLHWPPLCMFYPFLSHIPGGAQLLKVCELTPMLIWVGCQSGKCWCVGNPTVWTAPARQKGQVFQARPRCGARNCK